MKTRLINLWEKLRSSYWFLPSVMALGAIGCALGLGVLDHTWHGELNRLLAWLPGIEAKGARAFLSTVAGATITVTGVVFSVTIVALSLASQQFGPRLLDSFMRDRGNQAVFGSFIGTYLYCLWVLREIRGTGTGGFVPHLSLLLAFCLALFSVAVLIFFIHHVAESIQAMTVIANVSTELQQAIRRQFPTPADRRTGAWSSSVTDEKIPADSEPGALPVASQASGYLQAVDETGLLDLAARHDLVLRLAVRPGDFIARGVPLGWAWPRAHAEAEGVLEALHGCFIIGAKRSAEQDIEHLLNQLTEVAVRALSPGVNDPFTAINCIDYLGAAFCELAGRAFPGPERRGEDDRLRLVVRPRTFANLLDSAFDLLRQHGRRSAAVTLRLLETLAVIVSRTTSEEQRRALLRQAGMVERGSRDGLPEAADREAAHRRYLEIFQAVEKHCGLAGDL